MALSTKKHSRRINPGRMVVFGLHCTEPVIPVGAAVNTDGSRLRGCPGVGDLIIYPATRLARSTTCIRSSVNVYVFPTVNCGDSS